MELDVVQEERISTSDMQQLKAWYRAKRRLPLVIRSCLPSCTVPMLMLERMPLQSFIRISEHLKEYTTGERSCRVYPEWTGGQTSDSRSKVIRGYTQPKSEGCKKYTPTD